MRCLFHIYLAFDCTFPSQAEGKMMTLNIYEVSFSYIFSVRLHFSLTGRGKSDDTKYIWGVFVHIYVAFDYTFPSQAGGKVMTLNIYEVSFIWQFIRTKHISTSSIFSVITFPRACRGKTLNIYIYIYIWTKHLIYIYIYI